MRSLQNQIGWCGRVQWSLGGFLAAAVIAFYLFGYRPALHRLETLQMQIESKQRELDQSQNRSRDLRIIAAEVQELQGRVQMYDRQFPRQPELAQFIREITQISQQCALQDCKYQPQPLPRRAEGFFELSIPMQFQGEFENVASFLRQVEDLQRLTRVRRLSVKSKDAESGLVEVELAMNIYFSEG